MQNTQFRNEDIFGEIVSKEPISSEHITKPKQTLAKKT